MNFHLISLFCPSSVDAACFLPHFNGISKHLWNENEIQSAIIHFHFSISTIFLLFFRHAKIIFRKNINFIQLISNVGACECGLYARIHFKLEAAACKMNHLPIDLFSRHTNTQNIWFNLSSNFLRLFLHVALNNFL